MTEPLAYLNGQFIPNHQCVLPIYDAGIVLGAAVTDLLRTFRGRPFAAREHVRRFFESARYAYIDLGMSEAEMLGIVERLITHNLEAWPERELALVFYATVGQFPVYAGAAGMAGEMRATICLHCFPLPLQLWRSAIADGVHVVTPTQRHIHPATLNSKIKHRNRLHMWIGDQQAKLADPKAIGLYLDHDGNITETGGSNFLILKDGAILSPRRNNILWGVTLETVRRLSGPLGLQFAERDLQIHDVVNADEAWLCTTPYFLAAAVKINGIPIASGRPGPVWRRLMDAFSAEVGVDVAQQILDSP
jgi:branched-subunit amino acid aminotransferase/4-amino-4-deoxychorismate lyase